MEFLANRSGCHAKIPSASPYPILFIISLKIGRPGILAVCDSINSLTTFRFSRSTNSFSSVIWASMERICLSGSSVDFLA
ncbi:MAG: hypothetical protein A3I88_02940 [Candidatus Portnoybacteria bacterium RIFCSPLOWO2_12_FULL_39_9]|uniref:Uncharacterized protein n=1 Tax=Candidatus Portnoybacteria bacterium RIFCSPHIGHO2_12_FULL_38_9 TaxID=1801997 RepID=A0A1G2FIG5_9BACT|nr:MAG: hypothetical protein A3J64_02155 [Candidatus Portnoybacteria bacterium RIFCSPHIGHO2_12_FULL_38_9]OGZ41260.1 MAG: hypothetical protein A3I88_02940 [Candidatus Portnoybacteria bacterium RIFCSPLOWO2_12_FULL_39_9]